MKKNITISLDTMGGSNAPGSTIRGAAIAMSKHQDLHLILFGSNEILSPFLHHLSSFSERYTIVHTTDVIDDNEQPVKALRNGKESSMRKSIDSVKEGMAQATVSSGNTGALMVMAKLVLGDMPGIKRPAIISAIPNKNGKSILLDLGANAECDDLNLFQFALMGNAYAKIILGKNKPKIGLLNVGVESIKGTSLQKKAHDRLSNSNLNYLGYIEGCDVAKGKADVIVVDGFTGNIMLKFGEGVIRFMIDIVRNSFKTNLFTKLLGSLMKKHLKKSFSIIDPSNLNGAMFIGVNGIVVKSHGSSDYIGVSSAIGVAYELAKKDINQEIATELKELQGDNATTMIVEKIKKTFGIKS